MESLLFIALLLFAGWCLCRAGVGSSWNVPFLPEPKQSAKQPEYVPAAPVVVASQPIPKEQHEKILKDAYTTVKASLDAQAKAEFDALIAKTKPQ